MSHVSLTDRGGGLVETFSADLELLPEAAQGFVWLMNQSHLLDPARQQLTAGLEDLVRGRDPDTGGMSMTTLGRIILAVFVVSLAVSVRSFVKLRGWAQRSREMSVQRIVLKIAPHVAVPVAVLVFVYRFIGPVLLGEPRAFNFRNVGYYYLPDVTLLILLAIVPDLLQTVMMSTQVVIDRVVRPRRRSSTAHDIPGPAVPRSDWATEVEASSAGPARPTTRLLRAVACRSGTR